MAIPAGLPFAAEGLPFVPEGLPIAASTFALIALAEIGDKSQLVCMTLAMRHRHLPVLLGAAVAFMVLNTAAVLAGASLGAWIPDRLTGAIVAVLFAGFGIHMLRSASRPAETEVEAGTGHGIFLTTVLLLVVAEFGDKTQIAVAALAGSMAPLPVWIGATAALVAVSALGIWAGRTVLTRLPLPWLHRTGASVFLLFAAMAAWSALA